MTPHRALIEAAEKARDLTENIPTANATAFAVGMEIAEILDLAISSSKQKKA